MFKNIQHRDKVRERFYRRIESLRELYEQEKEAMNTIERKKLEKAIQVLVDAYSYLGS